MYDDEALAIYRDFVQERHRIWEKRQNNEPPLWTENVVLQNQKFTNTFRVLDPGSQFVFELDTENPVDLITRLVLYRVTNLPNTWHVMREELGRYPLTEDMNESLIQIIRQYRGFGNRVFSGAYIIMPEPGLIGMDKVPGAVNLARRFAENKADSFLSATTEDQRFDVLRSTHGLGTFLSMQILADWQYLQKEEPDLSFVVAGPGSRRGAQILNKDLKPESVIYDLAAEWSESESVRVNGRSLTPMDVQNTLCEFSKYHGPHTGMSPLRRTKPYVPAHPGPQDPPVLPKWWTNPQTPTIVSE